MSENVAEGVTRRLAEHAATLQHEEIPAEVIERAKLFIADFMGIAVRAFHDADSTPSLIAGAEALGAAGEGGASASVIGTRRRLAPPVAAFVNGAIGHSMDFDPMNTPASLAPSPPIMPAVFAAAEMSSASGRDVLAAIVVGYDVTCKISKALVPADMYERGFHPTAVAGCFGATAAAGRVLGLSTAQMMDAFGIALSEAAGSMQYLRNGAWTKRFQAGNAGRNGLVAATLAKHGFSGAVDALEGRFGLFHAYVPNPKPDEAIKDLRDVWEVMTTGIKPYPACRLSHAVADLGAAYFKDHGDRSDDIVEVIAGLSKTGMVLTGVPQEQKREPKSVVDGQFSTHFTVAVMLRQGKLDWDDYGPQLRDEKTLALTRKVSVFEDAEVESNYPGLLSGSLKLVFRDGTTHKAFQRVPKGDPENFVTAQEVRTKFSSLVRPCLGDAGDEALFRVAMNMDKHGVAALFAATLAETQPQRADA
ncbi:MmgE/PrpD family protein [Pseudorhodoplanes sp.]|uniref:MmgE/PrpD family protein n=1 Tax=Pseudorhodoplanes sp. TaxID=1934341 RepID=UPI003D0EF83F